MNYSCLVPCAGRNPAMLAGCALCWAEPCCSPGAQQTVPHHMPFKRTVKLPPVLDSTCVPPFCLCRAEPSPAPLGRALCGAEPSMTLEGQGPVGKPPMMCPAAGTRPVSQTALSKPPGVGVMNHLWVVPYAARRPPMLVGSPLCRPEPILETRRPAKGRTTHAIWRGPGSYPPVWKAQLFLSPLQLVGRALCRAEPSMTCVGRGVVAKATVMGAVAGTRCWS